MDIKIVLLTIFILLLALTIALRFITLNLSREIEELAQVQNNIKKTVAVLNEVVVDQEHALEIIKEESNKTDD